MEAQFVADCQALILINANLSAEIVTAVTSAYADAGLPDPTRVDQLEARFKSYGTRIAAFPATSARALQCKRAIVGLLLTQQDEDPVPLCDTLLLSLLMDFESMFAPSNGEGGRDNNAEAYTRCLTQIGEVFADCVRVGVMPWSPETEQLVAQVNAKVTSTRKLVLRLASTPAGSALATHSKGRVLRQLMSVGGADVHEPRLALARSFITDVAALGPAIDIEDGALRFGGHWWSTLAGRLWRPKGGSPSL